MQATEINTCDNIRQQLLLQGSLTPEIMQQLRTAVYNGPMTLAKGDFLFSIKDKMKSANDNQEFRELFIQAICDLLLDDPDSPGEIDDAEAKWLRAQIQNDGSLDRCDRELLHTLRDRSINFPSILNYKSRLTRRLESTLYLTRYLTFVAIIGSVLSALALFVKGGMIVWSALTEFIHDINNPHYEEILEMFVSSVDVFLFAMVLIIFGVGVYELFISKLDPVSAKADGRPSWMHISSVDDLKSALGKVILMVLIVTFFKYSLAVKYHGVNDLLKLGVGIVLIALSMFITNKSHKH